uniref:Uncharacterized protein n=1 Tax=viral metagenome TaxID=1070528 RepID=A0A6C0LZH9_9ZZZZ
MSHARDQRYTLYADMNNAGLYTTAQRSIDGARFRVKPNINVRKLYLHNSGGKTINATISLSSGGEIPISANDTKYTLLSGEQVALAVNPNGSTMQYIWITDTTNTRLLGSVHPIRPGVVDMAIREGETNWFVVDFVQP